MLRTLQSSGVTRNDPALAWQPLAGWTTYDDEAAMGRGQPGELCAYCLNTPASAVDRPHNLQGTRAPTACWDVVRE